MGAEENEVAEIEIVEVKKLNDKTHNAYAAGINAIEAKVEADIEFAIQRYKAKLEKLKELTDSMLESGASFEETIDKAMNILNKKIEKIAMNTETANLVS